VNKCPYCFETITSLQLPRCPHCSQFIIDDIITVDYPSLDKKNCLYCGKKILREAKICRYCQKWLDEVDRAANDIDPEDLV
jgi:hypothetical protein